MSIEFIVNGKEVSTDVSPDTKLIWVLREHMQLTGTKYGCGIGKCKSCTVHLGGKAIHSCRTSISTVEGKEVTTIEGLSSDGTHPLQIAWIDEQVPQCGYCHSGQIMQAATLIKQNPSPTRKS